MSTEQQQPKFATMHEVMMKKSELINALVKNKAKHDVVLATAISGYWELAKQRLADSKKQFKSSVSDYVEKYNTEHAKMEKLIKNKESLPNALGVGSLYADVSFALVYPQDHSRDYDRAIRMMEASIYDDVKLSVSEFDAYVMNNWEWKNNFVNTNSAYITKNAKFARTSYSQPNFVTGCYAGAYNESARISADMFLCSGMAAF